jgi:hypothetical protein
MERSVDAQAIDATGSFDRKGNLMLRTRRAFARALVALVAAAALVPITAPAASAAEQEITTCNNWSWIISFANSRYTSAELGYGGDLYGMLRARATNPGPWEEFQICGRWDSTLNTRINWIVSNRNLRYVSAEVAYTGVDYGMLRARATSLGSWEKFKIERWGPNPAMYTIKSLRNGRYVSAELGYGGGRYGMLRARATSIGNWEKFFILCGTPATCWF